MIYAIGLDSDRTFRHFISVGERRGMEVKSINLRAVIEEGSWRLAIPDDGDSSITISGRQLALDPRASYYCRIMDLSTVQTELVLAFRWRGLIAALMAWLDHIPGKVINRPSSGSNNFTKPLHEYALQSYGFNVPPSLTSSNSEQLATFVATEPAIVKPASGVRADSRLVHAEEFASFHPLQGPVHLQRYIAGADVRAHVVGDHVHAELIRSVKIDYRRSLEVPTEFTSFELPDVLNAQLIRITKQLGLTFAGWDFKLADDGTYWCLEVNPMPGYDGYDHRLGNRISDSLFDQLTAPNPISADYFIH